MLILTTVTGLDSNTNFQVGLPPCHIVDTRYNFGSGVQWPRMPFVLGMGSSSTAHFMSSEKKEESRLTFLALNCWKSVSYKSLSSCFVAVRGTSLVNSATCSIMDQHIPSWNYRFPLQTSWPCLEYSLFVDTSTHRKNKCEKIYIIIRFIALVWRMIHKYCKYWELLKL